MEYKYLYVNSRRESGERVHQKCLAPRMLLASHVGFSIVSGRADPMMLVGSLSMRAANAHKKAGI